MNSHTSLSDYYKTNHDLMYWHKYSLTEIESMLPWEKEIYVGFILKEIEKQKRENNGS